MFCSHYVASCCIALLCFVVICIDWLALLCSVLLCIALFGFAVECIAILKKPLIPICIALKFKKQMLRKLNKSRNFLIVKNVRATVWQLRSKEPVEPGPKPGEPGKHPGIRVIKECVFVFFAGLRGGNVNSLVRLIGGNNCLNG